MDFVGGGGGGNSGTIGTNNLGLGSENGPILYTEPNRTSAIDDIRSVVIYIFIVTIFLSFFLILPGIRYEKFPTFLCITTSLIVTSIIVVALFGTSWHVGEAPISAAYKAFSRDRIQGDLSVKIGLQSVNITLNAHKYYILHATHGPIIMDNSPVDAKLLQQPRQQQFLTAASSPANPAAATHQQSSSTSSSSFSVSAGNQALGQQSSNAKLFIDQQPGSDLAPEAKSASSNLAEELLGDRTSDGASVDTELEVEEVFASSASGARNHQADGSSSQRRARSSLNETSSKQQQAADRPNDPIQQIRKRSADQTDGERPTTTSTSQQQQQPPAPPGTTRNSRQKNGSSGGNGQKYTLKRVNVDINYNERFYWIEPNQMSQEHQRALERGLPYPILTVVEYLSQDAAGFNWSRQYRSAGYYSSIILWLSLCVSGLMFFLHCAAPKYGIYALQTIGLLLLTTNFTYAILVPRDERKLVIPFENQSLTFKFGWNFWLVLIGGCLSLIVGTLIVIIDSLFPNFVFTTILDFDFDSHNEYYMHRRKQNVVSGSNNDEMNNSASRPVRPPFFDKNSTTSSSSSSTTNTSSNSPALSSSSSSTSSALTKGAGQFPHSTRLSGGDQNKSVTVSSSGQEAQGKSDIHEQQQQVMARKALIRNRHNQHHSHISSKSSSKGSKHSNSGGNKADTLSRRSSTVRNDDDHLQVRL